ncbi:MAG: hypothetical protein ACP5MD_04425 [Verrucomicrobiia bacterium]
MEKTQERFDRTWTTGGWLAKVMLTLARVGTGFAAWSLGAAGGSRAASEHGRVGGAPSQRV